MLNSISRIWNRLFLDERSSVSLGVFRIAAAVTVGTHVIPTLIPLADNYLATAFKEKNPVFFPMWILELIEKSPDGVVLAMVGLFYLCWFFFLIGFITQISCLLMNAACYYFYALNSLHIGTLSWDILLVTLFLMCLTPYPGDHFSVDAFLRRKRGEISAPRRTYFIQRLLQFQLAWTYFYTALCKITPGNWLTDNPYYYLMNGPFEGVIKSFWGRGVLAASPDLCFALGIAVLTCEILISLGLFIPKVRYAAIGSGVFFHILLLVTMHVPTVFFFLFLPQFLLFIPPEKLIRQCDGARPR